MASTYEQQMAAIRRMYGSRRSDFEAQSGRAYSGGWASLAGSKGLTSSNIKSLLEGAAEADARGLEGIRADESMAFANLARMEEERKRQSKANLGTTLGTIGGGLAAGALALSGVGLPIAAMLAAPLMGIGASLGNLAAGGEAGTAAMMMDSMTAGTQAYQNYQLLQTIQRFNAQGSGPASPFGIDLDATRAAELSSARGT